MYTFLGPGPGPGPGGARAGTGAGGTQARTRAGGDPGRDPGYNTNRVYQLILCNMNGMFMGTNNIFICIGTPKTHLRRFRLAATAFIVSVLSK